MQSLRDIELHKRKLSRIKGGKLLGIKPKKIVEKTNLIVCSIYGRSPNIALHYCKSRIPWAERKTLNGRLQNILFVILVEKNIFKNSLSFREHLLTGTTTAAVETTTTPTTTIMAKTTTTIPAEHSEKKAKMTKTTTTLINVVKNQTKGKLQCFEYIFFHRS